MQRFVEVTLQITCRKTAAEIYLVVSSTAFCLSYAWLAPDYVGTWQHFMVGMIPLIVTPLFNIYAVLANGFLDAGFVFEEKNDNERNDE